MEHFRPLSLAARSLGLAVAGGLLALISGAVSTAQEQSSGVDWPASAAFARLKPPHHLDVVDASRLSADEQIMLATLQGLVNRRQTRIFVLTPAPEGKTAWLDTLAVPHSTVADPFELISRYRDEIGGVVVTDPNVQASVNVATTIAALDGLIVVSPALAEQLAARAHLTVREDLRGRFSDDLSAYTWAFEHLWPRTTHRILAGIGPAQRMESRDYAMATKALVVWLSIAKPGERALLERILREMPPNSVYQGWFSHDKAAGEVLSTTFYSSHGVSVVPTALASNLSVFAGVPADVSMPQPDAPPVGLANKVYILFTMSDGGNFGLLLHRMRLLWNDPARGSVPINWTMDSLLADLGPRILDYYRHNAKSNDYFISPTTGAGYMYPSYWPADALRPYTQQTGRYMRATGLTVLDLQNRGAPLPPAAAAAFVEDAKPLGIDLLQRGTFAVDVLEGTTPTIHSIFVQRPDQMAQALARVTAGWDGRSPRFVGLFLVQWNFTPSDIASFASTLGSQYQPLRGDAFFRLIRQWKGLPSR